MNNVLEYIEAYFSNGLSPEETLAFEKRCEEDQEFAREVSFYITSRSQLRALLKEQKRGEFKVLYDELAQKKSEKTGVQRWIPYLITAAAASILIFVVVTLNAPGAQKLAEGYIEQNLSTLSVTMGGQDSLQIAIHAFNEKDFERAEGIFQSLAVHDDLTAESTKYLGITYLVQQRYDEAIEQFDKLSAHSHLYANPGKFYGALTRMKRSTGTDVEDAKRLLKEVVDQKLPGRNEASEWIDRL